MASEDAWSWIDDLFPDEYYRRALAAQELSNKLVSGELVVACTDNGDGTVTFPITKREETP